MAFFSRLSDIISCNVHDLLGNTEDPLGAVRKVLLEMEEGLSGATRSSAHAQQAVQRLAAELEAHRAEIASWSGQAREEMGRQREDLARQALLRKREIEDLVAGLEQQYAAAVSTRDQLTTTLRAIGARLAEARRLERAIESRPDGTELRELLNQPDDLGAADIASGSTLEKSRADQVEAELEALRRELAKDS